MTFGRDSGFHETMKSLKPCYSPFCTKNSTAGTMPCIYQTDIYSSGCQVIHHSRQQFPLLNNRENNDRD